MFLCDHFFNPPIYSVLETSTGEIPIYENLPKKNHRTYQKAASRGIITRCVCNLISCLFQVQEFETHCGSLTQYGMKHTRAFANICNRGITKHAMEVAARTACEGYIVPRWNPLIQGYSA
jgi:hypothetical protein